MKLEEQVASALRAQTDLMQPPPLHLDVIRAGAQTQTRRRAAIAVASATLVVAAVVSGVALVLDGPDPAPQPANLERPKNGHGFAWSPDGRRVAVTGGQLIISLSASDGSLVDRSSGNGQAPLAWLAKTDD